MQIPLFPCLSHTLWEVNALDVDTSSLKHSWKKKLFFLSPLIISPNSHVKLNAHCYGHGYFLQHTPPFLKHLPLQIVRLQAGRDSD